MERATTIVRVNGLVKDFRPGFGLRKKRVLHGISFEVRRGEIFGFVGPNGAGKTTTLKVLLGLIRAERRRSVDLSATTCARPPSAATSASCPRTPTSTTSSPAREILRFYARLCGVPRAAARARASTSCSSGWASRTPATRGCAPTRRACSSASAIAQALVHDPSVVFLDEPMSGLDPIGRKEIRDLILRLHAEGKTVFMNTHILSDVEMLCDRVAIIVKRPHPLTRARIEEFLERRAQAPT